MSFEDFGSALLSSLTEQAGISENKPTNPNNPYDYSALGQFKNRIDQTAERRYVESGVKYNMRPRNLDIMMQEPDAVILVKKRQFSSLAENYRYDLMNQDEKNYIRATKRLFYNKCRQIAAYERLTKVEKIIKNNGGLNDSILPGILGSVELLNTLSPGLISGETLSSLELIKQIKNLSNNAENTSWINYNEIPYLTDVGDGTGVIELTLISSFSTQTSTKFDGGSLSAQIDDPYGMMIITSKDIEKAISDTVGFTNNLFFSGTNSILLDATNNAIEQLNSVRKIRGASRIIFKENENSILFKKIRAIIDEEGREIIFSFDGGVLGFNSSVQLDNSALVGVNGLLGIEVGLFSTIVENKYQLLGLAQTTNNDIKTFNKSNNFVRERMFLDFDGKSIIQSQDIIHVFASSKSQVDSKISQGFSSTFSDNLLSKIDSTIGNINTSIDNIANGFSSNSGETSFIEAERNIIAGPDFPLWLWSIMRTSFSSQAVGPQIFQGVIESVQQEYSNGIYSLNISAKDNCSYFTKGQLNIKPSLDVIDSSLYDPLTPFKTDYDLSSGMLRGEIPDLLDENISLLATNSVKAKTGRNKGKSVDQENYFLRDVEVLTPENPDLAKFRVKFHDPDGLVYRWKRGIGSLTMTGEPNRFGTGSLRNETSPVITNDPYQGQDVMNVLSLLITGQPYNFNTFLRAASNSGFITRDDLFNKSWSESFLKGLIANISQNNAVWGNFIPFKKMIVNSDAYNFLRSGEFDIATSNKKLNELLKQRASRFEQLATIFPEVASNPQFYKTDVGGSLKIDEDVLKGLDQNSVATLGIDIIDLDLEINKIKNSFEQQVSSANIRSTEGNLRIIGNDITFDPTLADTSGITPEEQKQGERDFRKKLFNLIQRQIFKVRANNDINYFIVDDSYDKNYDIQAFEATLGGALSLFKSTFQTISSQIQGVSKLLGIEVFADSQGHINARAPQYNRIPSSVFRQMMKDKNTKGIQIFPPYLESLFFNQVQGVTDKLQIIEDQIRLRASVLGYVRDINVESFLSGSMFKSDNPRSTGFKFLTAQEDGRIGAGDVRNLLMQATPDFMQEINQKALVSLGEYIKFPANTAINFDIVKRAEIVNKNISINTNEVNSRFDLIYNRLKALNVNPPSRLDLMPNDKSSLISSGATRSGFSQVDVLAITEQISSFLSERQYLIKVLANSIKNLEEGVRVNNDEDLQGALFPDLNSTAAFPEILEHMIEDESHDDLGFNSGKRFIIKASDIISVSIRENLPPYTIVEVNGAIANNLVQGPSGLEIGSSGNFVCTAFSVDYDMWRQYGFLGQSSVSVPYFSDPVTQCAPYGVYLLNQARKNIFNADVVIRGNEYIQPGEVYYLEDRDMLFYCEEVYHSFSFGQTFTTRLKLTYGHKPGQFIPTQLDIIGKGLYSNRNQSDLVRHVRNQSSNGDIPITIIVHDNNTTNSFVSSNTLESLLNNSFGNKNRQNLATLMLAANGFLTPTRDGQKMKIEIRTYFNSKEGASSGDGELSAFAEEIKGYLLNPSLYSVSQESTISDGKNKPQIDAKDISIVAIDLGDVDDTKSPSTQAWSIARSLALNSTGTSTLGEESDINYGKLAIGERTAIFTKVIDIWAVFEDPDPKQLDQKDNISTPEDQDTQQKRAEYLEAFYAKLGIN